MEIETYTLKAWWCLNTNADVLGTHLMNYAFLSMFGVKLRESMS